MWSGYVRYVLVMQVVYITLWYVHVLRSVLEVRARTIELKFRKKGACSVLPCIPLLV